MRVVDCLDECARSNVVVLRNGAAGRRVWIGAVNDDAVVGELVRWLGEGRGLDELPTAVLARRFDRADDVARQAEPIALTRPRR